MNKKILIFIDWFLPAYKAGGPVRSIANLVEHLKNDFEFFIITRDTEYLEQKSLENIKSNEWNNFGKNIQVFYCSKNNLNINFFKKIILKTDFDIIYINGIYSFYFSILPLILTKKVKKDKKIIVASRGMLAESAIQIKSFKKVFFLKIMNFFKIYENVNFHATKKDEIDDIRNNINSKVNISLASNLPKFYDKLEFIEKIKNRNELNLIYVGRISPEKNVIFLFKILCKIKKGKVILDLFGSIYDKNYWQKCQTYISKLPENIKINYKGVLSPENIENNFKHYHFLFFASKGENFGHVILESLTSSCPVIISNQTPWLDLEEKKIGWDIDLEDEKKWIKIIQQCIDMGKDEFNILSENAFQFAVNFLTNGKIIEKNKLLFT